MEKDQNFVGTERVRNLKNKIYFFIFCLNLSSPTDIGLLIFSIVNKQAQQASQVN